MLLIILFACYNKLKLHDVEAFKCGNTFSFIIWLNVYKNYCVVVGIKFN